jgi:hypothetical protein
MNVAGGELWARYACAFRTVPTSRGIVALPLFDRAFSLGTDAPPPLVIETCLRHLLHCTLSGTTNTHKCIGYKLHCACGEHVC